MPLGKLSLVLPSSVDGCADVTADALSAAPDHDSDQILSPAPLLEDFSGKAVLLRQGGGCSFLAKAQWAMRRHAALLLVSFLLDEVRE